MAAALLVLLAANILAFIVYGFDKRQAQHGRQRVSEGALILLAILGGIGAWIGCEVHRVESVGRRARCKDHLNPP